MRQPPIHPSWLVSQYDTVPARVSPPGTHTPPISCWSSSGFTSEVIVAIPCGVTRSCAPPSIVWSPGNLPPGSGWIAEHDPQPPIDPHAPTAGTSSAESNSFHRALQTITMRSHLYLKHDQAG